MFNEIAKEVVRKDHIPMRCCIYKDRAIVAERIRIALGGNKKQPGVVEVIDIACDDCPQAWTIILRHVEVLDDGVLAKWLSLHRLYFPYLLLKL